MPARAAASNIITAASATLFSWTTVGSRLASKAVWPVGRTASLMGAGLPGAAADLLKEPVGGRIKKMSGL